MSAKMTTALLALSLAAPALAAPGTPEGTAPGSKPRFRFGGGLLFGAPTGEFRDHVGAGGGLSGHVLLTAPRGILALRVDGSWLLYGSETIRAPLSDTANRVLVDVARTDNWIAQLSAGPQIMAPSGRVRPYANAFAGVAYFSTTSEPTAPPPFAFVPLLIETTNLDDATFSYGGGAGLLVPLGSGRVSLDVGARYVDNGRVRFLTKGDIRDDGRGGSAFTPRRSKGNVIELRVGVTMTP